ncbi:MAG: aspartate/glutamate racemase family protein [Candidatus Gracilibacteria bacterium]
MGTNNLLQPVGVFDTGVGGLALVREIHRQDKSRDVHFFTDNQRFPYGDQSRETVAKWLLQIADFFKGEGVNQMLLGCNTATAMSSGLLPVDKNIEIKGPIDDTVRAIREQIFGTAVILATDATINTRAYQDALSTHTGRVVPVGGKGLERVIERDGVNSASTAEATKKSIVDIRRALGEHGSTGDHVDVVLGCTHYALAEGVIRRIFLDEGLEWGVFNPLPTIVDKMIGEKSSAHEHEGQLTVLHTAPYSDEWWSRCARFMPQDMPVTTKRILLKNI